MIKVGDKVVYTTTLGYTKHHGVVTRVRDGGRSVDLLIASSGEVRHLGVPVDDRLQVVADTPESTAVCEYVDAIRNMLATAGLEAANVANHKALETKKITLEQFQAAARVLAAEILNR